MANGVEILTIVIALVLALLTILVELGMLAAAIYVVVWVLRYLGVI